MPKLKPFTLSPGVLRGLFFLQKYRSLTMAQFATVAGAATGKGPALRMAANSAGAIR